MSREWVENTIEDLSQFGKGQKGITRLAYSEAERSAREYIINVMKDAGLTVRVDEAGNIIGRLEGTNSDAPAVLTGSHIDTVPEGGKFDGVVGIVGAIAAVKTLKSQKALTHPVEVVVFAGKESSRFGYMTIGSKTMAGLANISNWSKAIDNKGISFVQALEEHGLDIKNLHKAARKKSDIKAYVELHVEQGPFLDKDKVSIGIIETIAGATRLKITVDGVAANSGSTPMEYRNDALVSASMIVLAVQEIAMEQSYQDTVATVGKLLVHPGAINVIPGLVELFVDIRGTNQESIIETLQEIMDEVTNIANQQETPVAMKVISSEKPVAMDNDLVDLIETVCEDKQLSCRHMTSGAGHDAMSMTYIAPSGMIFIPSKDGLSHNLDEHAEIDDIMRGIDVLTAVIENLAK